MLKYYRLLIKYIVNYRPIHKWISFIEPSMSLHSWWGHSWLGVYIRPSTMGYSVRYNVWTHSWMGLLCCTFKSTSLMVKPFMNVYLYSPKCYRLFIQYTINDGPIHERASISPKDYGLFSTLYTMDPFMNGSQLVYIYAYCVCLHLYVPHEIPRTEHRIAVLLSPASRALPGQLPKLLDKFLTGTRRGECVICFSLWFHINMCTVRPCVPH